MRIYIFLLGLFLIFSAPAQAQGGGEGIAAVVNQDAISMTDLRDRTKLILVSSGLPDTAEIRAKLLKQVMDGLIEEQLMLQEARKRDISVSDAEIDQGFAALAAQNKIPPEKFAEAIQRSGINMNTMQRQIRAQMSWSKVIQKVMRSQVTVSDGDIDEYLSRIGANMGKEEFLLAEIFLPVEEGAQDAEVSQLAAKLVAEMRAGRALFFKVAQQFSKAPGAQSGGDLGWLQQGQLAPALDAALATLKIEEVSDPIRAQDGYHILYLREKRLISDESLPSREEAMNTIGVQRLERLQRRYMMDLKSTAFIENRVQS